MSRVECKHQVYEVSYFMITGSTMCGENFKKGNLCV